MRLVLIKLLERKHIFEKISKIGISLYPLYNLYLVSMPVNNFVASSSLSHIFAIIHNDGRINLSTSIFNTDEEQSAAVICFAEAYDYVKKMKGIHQFHVGCLERKVMSSVLLSFELPNFSSKQVIDAVKHVCIYEKWDIKNETIVLFNDELRLKYFYSFECDCIVLNDSHIVSTRIDSLRRKLK